MQKDVPQPEWFDLKALSAYASVCEKTLRAWIHATQNPLPACQRGTKIYVRKSEFDRWLEGHTVRNKAGIDSLVNEIVDEVRKSAG